MACRRLREKRKGYVWKDEQRVRFRNNSHGLPHFSRVAPLLYCVDAYSKLCGVRREKRLRQMLEADTLSQGLPPHRFFFSSHVPHVRTEKLVFCP